MSTESVRAPVILLGMHRSGTTAVTRVLNGAGLFIGRRRDINEESLFFQDLNRWVFRAVPTFWDRPLPVRRLIEEDEIRRMIVANLRDTFGSLRFRRKYAVLRRVLRSPWGWKDPRNTFTLPLWLEVFPEARVIHVRRHGVDVAASLRERERQIRGRARDRFEAHGRFPGPYPVLSTSVRCQTLEGGFSLWEEYLAEAERQMEGLGERGIEVRFEDLLARPEDEFPRLCKFCGLQARASGHSLDADRAFAFRHDPELVQFCETVTDRLRRFGYGKEY